VQWWQKEGGEARNISRSTPGLRISVQGIATEQQRTANARAFRERAQEQGLDVGPCRVMVLVYNEDRARPRNVGPQHIAGTNEGLIEGVAQRGAGERRGEPEVVADHAQLLRALGRVVGRGDGRGRLAARVDLGGGVVARLPLARTPGEVLGRFLDQVDDMAVQGVAIALRRDNAELAAAGDQYLERRHHLVGRRRPLRVAAREVVVLAAFGLVVHGDEDAQRAVGAALGHVDGRVLSLIGVLAALPLLVVQAPPVGERHVAGGQGARGHRSPPPLHRGACTTHSPLPPIAYAADRCSCGDAGHRWRGGRWCSRSGRRAVVRALPAAVFFPDPSSRATPGDLVALTFRNRL